MTSIGVTLHTARPRSRRCDKPRSTPVSIDHLPRNCVLLHLLARAKTLPQLLSVEEPQLVGHVGRAWPRRIPIAKQSLGLCPSFCELDQLHIVVTAVSPEMVTPVERRKPEEDAQHAERRVGAALRGVRGGKEEGDGRLKCRVMGGEDYSM